MVPLPLLAGGMGMVPLPLAGGMGMVPLPLLAGGDCLVAEGAACVVVAVCVVAGTVASVVPQPAITGSAAPSRRVVPSNFFQFIFFLLDFFCTPSAYRRAEFTGQCAESLYGVFSHDLLY
jgi:hypothetical protein